MICFIAANWEHIGKCTRLYGMQALMVTAVAVVARLGLTRLGGHAPRLRKNGYAVFALNAEDIGRFVRIQPAPRPIATGEVAVRYRQRNWWEIHIASNAWFFPEGQAKRYAPAKYGELRVNDDGEALLTGLREGKRKPL